MPKGLCMTALVISILVFVLFFADYLLGVFGLARWAPFHYAQPWFDIVFMVCAIVLGVFSYLTYREQA